MTELDKIAPTAAIKLLTNAECQQIIEKARATDSKLQLEDFLLTPAKNASGYLGEYYHLLVQYSVAEPDENKNLTVGREMCELHAFVKRVPQASAEPEKEAIFRKEAALYTTLLQQLRKYSTVAWSPRCYYARDDLIVLEDLEKLGYALYPSTEACLPKHYLRKVLRTLAAQHASSLALEQIEGVCIGDIYPQLDEEITVSQLVPWYTTGLRAIRALVTSQLEAQPTFVRETIEARFVTAIASVYGMINSSTKYWNVLCHRDIWRGNVFFSDNTVATSSANEYSVMFVDYQTARYCPPAIDLIYILFMNLDKATRKAEEMEYLRFYYDYLESDCVANGFEQTDVPFSFSDLMTSYWEFQFFGLLYRAIASTILNVPRAIVTNFYVHVERTDAVLKLMADCPDFRKYMAEQICDILQFLSEESYDRTSRF
ncbi:PREDICTED: uncharacterized protein LOC108973774 [Bactrocera latifrons]|uniref:CHK kinase-like domain-containing protein n=1 Tax=Bactrocera latifrons TaxID=174628 RepID=A0A0K8UB04_BACLA|nr:PREDICTED: uncharacterized protein LOC108973774 [Bactrocera latifrons]